MQLRDRFPVDAVGGGDFVSGNSGLEPGERIVDLDVDLDALPMWGRLCVHERTVAMMADLLGLCVDGAMPARLATANDQLMRLRAVNRKLREALGAVIDVAALIKLNMPEVTEEIVG